MELDEFLWRSKLSQRQFSKKTGINAVTISNMKNFTSIPNLKTAMIIHKFSEGKISLIEMIPPAMRKDYEVKGV